MSAPSNLLSVARVGAVLTGWVYGAMRHNSLAKQYAVAEKAHAGGHAAKPAGEHAKDAAHKPAAAPAKAADHH